MKKQLEEYGVSSIFLVDILQGPFSSMSSRTQCKFSLQPRIDEIEHSMEVRDRKLDQLKEKLNSVEDDVFADFCTSIGVANIRQYEERELRYALLIY